MHEKRAHVSFMHSREALPQADQNTRRNNTPLRAHHYLHVVLIEGAMLRTPTAKAAVDAVKWLKSVRPPPDALRIAFDVDALNLM